MIEPDCSIPFDDILNDHFAAAVKQLDFAEWGFISDHAADALRQSLMMRFSELTAPTLIHLFKVFKEIIWPESALFVKDLPANSNTIYLAFVNYLVGNWQTSLLKHYPLLRELLEIEGTMWAAVNRQLFDRLVVDWPEIQASVWPETVATDTPWRLVDLVDRLSDPHQGGQTVTVLTFANGQKLVYKPKPLQSAVAWRGVVELLVERGLKPDLYLPKVIAKEGYGWVEYITHEACIDDQEVVLFYERQGIWLALFYAFRGRDYHAENMIAQGAYPVPIDFEMLFQPLEEAPVAATAMVDQYLAESLLSIGLLPTWQKGIHGDLYNNGGIGAAGIDAGAKLTYKWIDVNLDSMKRVWGGSDDWSQSHMPLYVGEIVAHEPYVEAILNGFRHGYLFLMAQRAFLLGTESPITQFKGQRLRFVSRSTHIYYRLRKYLQQPKQLRSEDALQAGLVKLKAGGRHSRIVEAERKAIAQRDIPYFSQYSDSVDLIFPDGQTIVNYFTLSGYASVVARLQQIDELDLKRQLEIARLSLISKQLVAAVDDNHPVSTTFVNQILLKPAQLIAAAKKIAQKFEEIALIKDGEASWIAFAFDDDVGCYHFQSVGEGLYSGASGIALFLAALYHLTAEDQYKQLAEAALQPLSRLDQIAEVGGIAGWAGDLYALSKISGLLDEPEWEMLAKQIAVEKGAEFVPGQYDLLAGAAGNLLALLALYEQCGDQQLLQTAVTIADQMYEERMSNGVWHTFADHALAGMAHGMSGVALALARLYQHTHEPKWAVAVDALLTYEQTLFDEQAGNWRDLRAGDDENQFNCRWCDGAPGITLTRLAIGTIPNWQFDTVVSQDLNHGFATNLDTSFVVDHLCCGLLGRAELILGQGIKSNDERLIQQARRWGSAIVNAGEDSGRYRVGLPTAVPDYYAPGFFQGLAGIGYQLLRLAVPDQLPAILLFE